MIVRLRIEVSDEARRAIRERSGREGLADRTEVRAYIAEHFDEIAEQQDPPPRARRVRAAMVAPSPAALYRSVVSGEDVTADDLTDCDRCDGTGGCERICPDCGGLGVLEGYGGVLGQGDHVTPRRVVASPVRAQVERSSAA